MTMTTMMMMMITMPTAKKQTPQARVGEATGHQKGVRLS
jgi:hypothetical protein